MPIASTIILGGVSGAYCIEPYTDRYACFKVIDQLSQAVVDKRMRNAEQAKIDEMLGQLENHCEEGEFDDATALAGDIQNLIGTAN